MGSRKPPAAEDEQTWRQTERMVRYANAVNRIATASNAFDAHV
jgi:hypothetical protein